MEVKKRCYEAKIPEFRVLFTSHLTPDNWDPVFSSVKWNTTTYLRVVRATELLKLSEKCLKVFLIKK